MVRLRIRVKYSRRVLVPYACAAACLVAAGLVALLAPPSEAAPSQAMSAPDVPYYWPQGAGRHVYLTDQSYRGDQALIACSRWYRMASLWEILDTSNWVYDYDHPAAHTNEDSGHGPPSNWFGWIRTGCSSGGDAIAGTGNCHAWTSGSGSDYGTAVRLSNTWQTAPGEILAWDAIPVTCNLTGPVWCVADVQAVHMPLVLKGYP